MKARRWWRIGLLLALPVGLLLLIAERRSWKPAILRVPGKAFQLAFSPDGKILAIAFHDSVVNETSGVELWQVQAPTAFSQAQWSGRKTLKAPYLGSIAFAPLEPTLAGLSYSGAKIWLWNLPNGRLKRILPTSDAGGQYLHFWPRFDVLTYYDGVETIQQSMRTGKIIRRMNRGTLFSPDGKTVVRDDGDEYGSTFSDDIVLWNLRRGRPQQTLRRGACREKDYCSWATGAFSPDGARLAVSYTRQDAQSAEHHSVGLWDVANAQLLTIADLKMGITSFAFSPDGRWLAACDGSEIVRVWSVVSGRTQRELLHRGPVSALAFSPDNRILATATSGGTIALWRMR